MEAATAIPGQTDIDDFKEEAGEAVGPMPQEPVDNTPPVAELDEIRVRGTTQLGLFDAGGKSPTSSSLTLTGGKFDLMDGQAFRKGDTVVLTVVCVVDTVTLKDKTDRKVGVVTACEQQHRAYISDAQVVEHS